jgi:hypothetical protein
MVLGFFKNKLTPNSGGSLPRRGYGRFFVGLSFLLFEFDECLAKVILWFLHNVLPNGTKCALGGNNTVHSIIMV